MSSLLQDLKISASPELLAELEKFESNVQVKEVVSTRGAKNPYSGNYESQESNLTFNFNVGNITIGKVETILMSYSNQIAFLIDCAVTELISKETYGTKRKSTNDLTLALLEALVKSK